MSLLANTTYIKVVSIKKDNHLSTKYEITSASKSEKKCNLGKLHFLRQRLNSTFLIFFFKKLILAFEVIVQPLIGQFYIALGIFIIRAL